MTSRRPSGYLLVLVAIYAALSVLTLVSWSARGVSTPTGDEPHYLVAADGLVRYGSLGLSAPYADEFASRTIYELGLAPAGSTPTPPSAHVVDAPSGLFSWHGAGVSFLVAVPYAVAGVEGARLMMVLLGALIVILIWRLSGIFVKDPRLRFASSLVVAISFLLLPASTQIYPDLLAGLLALSGIYFVLTPELVRSRWSLVGYSFIVGFLPWVGMKFAITAVILLAAMVVSELRRRRDFARAAWLVGPAAVVVLLLLIYNVRAFGQLAGPPVEGTLEVSWTAFMVLLGLLFDQDQGILLQNPVLLLGLAGLVPFARRFGLGALAWGAVFVSIWLPSAMHPGWYGLGSFVGRYSWALAVLFAVPTLLALAWLATNARRAFWVIVGAGIAVNAAFFTISVLLAGSAPGGSAGFDLYTKPAEVWLESYAIFYFPLQDWLPALYNSEWALTFWPNAAWLLVALALVLVAVRWRVALVVGAVGLVAVTIAGFVGNPGPRSDVLTSDVTAGADAGYLAVGPSRQMRQGPYEWSVAYSADSPADVVVGRWEIVSADDGAVAAAGELRGTDGAPQTVTTNLPYFSARPREYTFRVASYAPMSVQQTGVRHG